MAEKKTQDPTAGIIDLVEIVESTKEKDPPHEIDFDSQLSDLLGKGQTASMKEPPELESLLGGSGAGSGGTNKKETSQASGDDFIDLTDPADDPFDALTRETDKSQSDSDESGDLFAELTAGALKGKTPAQAPSNGIDAFIDDLDVPPNGAAPSSPAPSNPEDKPEVENLDSLLDSLFTSPAAEQVAAAGQKPAESPASSDTKEKELEPLSDDMFKTEKAPLGDDLDALLDDVVPAPRKEQPDKKAPSSEELDSLLTDFASKVPPNKKASPMPDKTEIDALLDEVPVSDLQFAPEPAPAPSTPSPTPAPQQTAPADGSLTALTEEVHRLAERVATLEQQVSAPAFNPQDLFTEDTPFHEQLKMLVRTLLSAELPAQVAAQVAAQLPAQLGTQLPAQVAAQLPTQVSAQLPAADTLTQSLNALETRLAALEARPEPVIPEVPTAASIGQNVLKIVHGDLGTMKKTLETEQESMGQTLTDMQKKLSAMEEQLSSREQDAPAPVSASVDTADMSQSILNQVHADLEQETSTIQKRLETLETRMADLEQSVPSVQPNPEEVLEQTQPLLEELRSDLEKETAAIHDRLSMLEGQLAAAESQTASVSPEVSPSLTEDTVTQLHSELEKVSTAVQSRIEALETQITALKTSEEATPPMEEPESPWTQIKALEEEITALQGRIGMLEEQLTALPQPETAGTDAIDATAEALAQTENKLESLSNELKAKHENTAQALTELQNRLWALEEQLSATAAAEADKAASPEEDLLNEVHATLDTVTAEAASAHDALTQRIDELQNRLATLEGGGETGETEKEPSQAVIEEILNQVRPELTKSLEEAASEQELTALALSALQARVDTLENQSRPAETTASDPEELMQPLLNRLHAELEKAATDTLAMHESTTLALTELQSRLTSLEESPEQTIPEQPEASAVPQDELNQVRAELEKVRTDAASEQELMSLGLSTLQSRVEALEQKKAPVLPEIPNAASIAQDVLALVHADMEQEAAETATQKEAASKMLEDMQHRLSLLETRPTPEVILPDLPDATHIAKDVLEEVRQDLDKVAAESAARVLREEIAALANQLS